MIMKWINDNTVIKLQDINDNYILGPESQD